MPYLEWIIRHYVINVSQETRTKTRDSIDTGPRTGDDNLVINELLCFVQGHLGGPPKQILLSVLGDIFLWKR